MVQPELDFLRYELRIEPRSRLKPVCDRVFYVCISHVLGLNQEGNTFVAQVPIIEENTAFVRTLWDFESGCVSFVFKGEIWVDDLDCFGCDNDGGERIVASGLFIARFTDGLTHIESEDEGFLTLSFEMVEDIDAELLFELARPNGIYIGEAIDVT